MELSHTSILLIIFTKVWRKISNLGIWNKQILSNAQMTFNYELTSRLNNYTAKMYILAGENVVNIVKFIKHFLV